MWVAHPGRAGAIVVSCIGEKVWRWEGIPLALMCGGAWSTAQELWFYSSHSVLP